MRRATGYTLVEMVVAMAMIAMLLGGLGSAVVLVGRGIDPATERQSDAAAALERIANDLTYAKQITTRGAATIGFSLADRGHGSSGDERAVVSWDGTAGSPLLLQYNGNTGATLLSRVERFSVDVTTRVGTLRSAPRVMLVVENATSMHADDLARQSQILTWGWTVTLVDDGASRATIDAAAAASDVVYISDRVVGASWLGKLSNPALGVVVEEPRLYSDMGLASGYLPGIDTRIRILTSAHDITASIVGTNPQIVTSSLTLTNVSGSIAPGATILANSHTLGLPALVVVEAGASLLSGTAAARRVIMPWGETNLFSFTSLTDDGLELLRRALTWAAAPVEIVTVELRLTPAGASRESFQIVELLNRPEPPKP